MIMIIMYNNNMLKYNITDLAGSVVTAPYYMFRHIGDMLWSMSRNQGRILQGNFQKIH